MYKYRSNLKLFLFWGTLCLLANIICTFAKPYDGDQSFWAGWIQQLIDKGFGGFEGNYPPLYVFWLWVVAKIHSIFGIVVGKTFFLKFTSLWPVFFAHLFLVDWICRIIEKFNYPDWKKHLLVAFVALNPALLLDGPIWGQVDLFPVVIAALSIYCICRPRYIYLAAMLYILSILAKFQMIAFLPIFGGLFIRNWRTSWKGLPLAIAATVLVLLPFALGNNLQGMLTRAYVQTTSQYAYTTYNAANLWYLLAGNAQPDNIPIFNASAQGLGALLKPIILGKILFVIVSLLALAKSIRCRNIRTAYALCSLNALAFFVVLPGMHERYLQYAVPMALCFLVWDMRRGGIPGIFITFVAAANVNLINPFTGRDIWTVVSVTACILLVVMLFATIAPKLSDKLICKAKQISFPAWVPYAILSGILLIEGSILLYQSRPILVPTGDNIVLLTDLNWIHAEQSYKVPYRNRSVDGHDLTAGNRIYRHGIGTHAQSELIMELPENADSLFVGAAIDGECHEEGSAKFFITKGKEILWQSGVITGKSNIRFAKVPVQGLSEIKLVTDPNGPDFCDHTDWLNGYIKLQQ